MKRGITDDGIRRIARNGERQVVAEISDGDRDILARLLSNATFAAGSLQEFSQAMDEGRFGRDHAESFVECVQNVETLSQELNTLLDSMWGANPDLFE